MSARLWTIVGQGLAGTCLAWNLWKRGAPFVIIDRENGGSSRVAAGLVNPVTGKNFEPSYRIGDFLSEALEFYAGIETVIGKTIWHPFPVMRLADSEKEWRKMVTKAAQPEIARWVSNANLPDPPEGWVGAIELTGGGRLDTRTFLDESREFFRRAGVYQKSELKEIPASGFILCEGAVGLISGKFGFHRCAKGEILTIRASGWDETRIRVGAGGWMVPIGQGLFKAGSTYEWNELDERPTNSGRMRVEEIIRRLGGGQFEIVGHDAGIRPILRRSEPLIGPVNGGNWMFNGLGSKGSLYAPGMARRLAEWIINGNEGEKEFDIRYFLGCA